MGHPHTHPPACCERHLFSQLFHRCQRAVQALPSQARRACSEQEERLLRNVVGSLAQTLQELSARFRRAQSGYLKRECPPVQGLVSNGGSGVRACNSLVFSPFSFATSLHFVLCLSLLAFEHIPTLRNRKELPSAPNGKPCPG